MLTAPAGSSAVHQVQIDSNSTIYGRVLRSGSSAQYSLTDSLGAPLSIANLVSEPIESTVWFDSFELDAVPVGSLDLTLIPGASDGQIDVGFFFDNGTRLVVTAEPSAVAGGGTTQLLAGLQDAGGVMLVGMGGVVTAEVILPDGSGTGVPLFDDGVHGDGAANDGLFGAPFGSPWTTLEGRYEVQVHALTPFGSHSVERSASVPFAVLPTGAAFAGPVAESVTDESGNGYYDVLNFDLPIAFTSNGSYRVTADLLDALGAVITPLGVSFKNTQAAGTTSVRLEVSAGVVTQYAVDGPWTLSNLTLIREDAGSLPIETAPDHVTQPYQLSTFAWPPLPLLSSLVPSMGSAVGGAQVVIVGTGLEDTTSVFIGQNPAQFTVQDDHSVLVTIPRKSPILRKLPTLLGSTGSPPPSFVPVDVTLTTPWGSHVLPGGFIYEF
jgi:hypothetical protein